MTDTTKGMPLSQLAMNPPVTFEICIKTMTDTAKPTLGPYSIVPAVYAGWDIRSDSIPCRFVHIPMGLSIKHEITPEESEENAKIVFDAFKVHESTGLTPRQLLEQRDALQERVRELESQIREMLIAVKYKSPPVDFGGGNYCYEARIPVAFVENAEAALGKHGGV